MRGLEVYLNDKLLCIAAFPGEGLLIACVEHLDISAPRYPERIAETSLRVLGSPHTVNEHLHFTENPVLKIGDEVRVRIVETIDPTEPITREDVTPPNPPKSVQPLEPEATPSTGQ
jgi:hypothetical protein